MVMCMWFFISSVSFFLIFFDVWMIIFSLLTFFLIIYNLNISVSLLFLYKSIF